MLGKKSFLLAALLILSLSAYAQYYSTGQSSCDIKWRQREFVLANWSIQTTLSARRCACR